MADVLPPAQRAVPLGRDHDTSGFDCGKPPLNLYLTRFALQNQTGGSARTYVALHAGRVVAYYSLAPGAVAFAEAPDRVAKGQAKHPVPVILMARFAVDSSLQGRGLGKAMLYDAFRRAMDGADVIGGRAFMVHAKDEDALAFYSRFGFEPSPADPLMLFVLFKDLRQSVGM